MLSTFASDQDTLFFTRTHKQHLTFFSNNPTHTIGTTRVLCQHR